MHRHIQTGISFALPILVVGGVCRGILSWEWVEQCTALFRIAALCEWLAPVVFAAYTGYSTGARPALIPALVAGVYSQTLCLGISGALIGALVSGVCVRALRELPFPREIRNIKTLLLLPVMTSLASVGMLHLLREPLLWLRRGFHMAANRLPLPVMCIVGAVMAGTISLGMGGEKGNICSLLANLCLMDGCVWPMAAKMAGCIVPGLVIAACRFGTGGSDGRQGLSLLVLKSVCQITEGAFPYLKQEPPGAVGACAVGAGLAGSLVVLWGVQCPAPHGGIFLLPFMVRPMRFLLALLLGALAGGALLLAVRRRKRTPPCPGSDPQKELPIEWVNF